MSRRLRASPGFQTSWLLLAVVALVMRIGSPPGTMLTQTAHGAELVLCTGHGPMAMMGVKAPPHGQQRLAVPAGRHSNGSCEFAAHAATGVLSSPPDLVGLSIAAYVTSAAAIVMRTTGHGLAAPPPPSQGPPSLFV